MVEFRLYYDDNGKVLCYTCNDHPEGNYIVINAQTYSEGRPDIKVIDGQIVNSNQFTNITRFVKSLSGTKCASTDISIVAMDDYEDITFWEMKINEYRNY